MVYMTVLRDTELMDSKSDIVLLIFGAKDLMTIDSGRYHWAILLFCFRLPGYWKIGATFLPIPISSFYPASMI